MKKFLVTVFMLVLPFVLFAQYKATIQEFTGKVEVKAVGAATWTPAVQGAVLEAGSTLSVGLKSSAVLALGNTKLNVKPLTRLTLKELVEKSDSLNTDLFLSVGKIGADVKPIEGKTQTFKVQSPVATASVRGTAFDFDGVTLEVVRGEVAMVNLSGVSVPVAAGESAVQDPEEPAAAPTAPLVALVQSSTVVTDLSATLAPAAPGGVVVPANLPSIDSIIETVQQTVNQTATLVITINS